MDRFTLALINLLFFLLYAGLMLVSAKISGARRATAWFAGANLSRAAGVLLFMVAWARGPRGFSEGGAVIMACGMAMLHRSFAELLERGQLLWRLQSVLVGVVAAGSVYGLVYGSARGTAYPEEMLLLSAVLGVQAALAASVVFSFAGEGASVAGWFTGVALAGYGLLEMMRVMVTLRYGSAGYEQSASEMTRALLVASLLANAAAAFGFVFLAGAKQRQELTWRAQVDDLTGLLNRWAFQRIALKELFRSKTKKGRAAVLTIDLDGFKQLNDTLGHGGGDAVLQAVAGVLQETVRERDAVGRMGGDEFCVLLPDTDLEEAMRVAERLRMRIEDLPVRYRDEVLRVKASFGVSSSERCGLNWQALVECGDDALYKAKREGRNRVMAAEGVDMEEMAEAQVGWERRRR